MQSNFIFDPVKHVYTLDGKPLTGVTTVLRVISKGDGLLQWAVNLAVEAMQAGKEPQDAKVAWKTKRDTAGTKGTDLHSEVESFVKACIHLDNGNPTAGCHESVAPFKEWAQSEKIRFTASEQRVFSRDLWLAGTYDLLLEKDGKKFIADVKTSKAIYPSYFYQMAAYRLMLEGMGVKDIEGAIVIRLNGGVETQYRYDYDTDKDAFLGALAIYRANATYGV